jgi:hypothetical protein
VRLTGGVGRSVGEGWVRCAGGRAEDVPRGPGGGIVGAREREKGRRLGPDSAQPKGDFLFYFYFSISFYLTPFSFKQKFKEIS